MTTYPDEEPRTIREVAIILRGINRKLEAMEARNQRLTAYVIAGIACPIVVGVAMALMFR